MVTIKDVAIYAGVSITTVSHVINKTRYVSPERTKRVLKAVDTLNYQPNFVARSLRSKTTKTIGMIIPDSSNPFFAEISRGIEDLYFKQGYNVFLCNSDQNPKKEKKYIELLTEKQIDGIVFVSSGGKVDTIKSFIDKDIPVIIADRFIEDLAVDSVISNNYMGGKLATNHLIQRGHKHIACITGPSNILPSWERVQGYRDSMLESGLSVEDDCIVKGNFQAKGGNSAMKELLNNQSPPTAVFVCNDLMAMGAINAIYEKGMSVPKDIAIVGFDNIALSAYTNPPLTTISQQGYEMGKIVAQLLIDRINNDKKPRKRYSIETKLIIRKSS